MNPNYLITLQARPLGLSETITLQTPVPENFSLQLNTDWTSQFASALEDTLNKIPGKLGGFTSMASNFFKASGGQPQTKLMSAQIWQGTSGLDLTVPFILKAHDNASKDVMDPIRKLMKLALPTTKGDLVSVLEAPFNPIGVANRVRDAGGGRAGRNGPAATAGNAAIQVQIGRFFYLPDCVITGISQSYDTIFDKFGMPLSAKVDVSLRSFFIITVEDVADMFPDVGVVTEALLIQNIR